MNTDTIQNMLKLMADAEKIMTDSSGMQKETYMLRVPCITLRESTEWVETLEGGWNMLVGADKGRIIEAVQCLSSVARQKNLFVGASGRVLNILGSIGCR